MSTHAPERREAGAPTITPAAMETMWDDAATILATAVREAASGEATEATDHPAATLAARLEEMAAHERDGRLDLLAAMTLGMDALVAALVVLGDVRQGPVEAATTPFVAAWGVCSRWDATSALSAYDEAVDALVQAERLVGTPMEDVHARIAADGLTKVVGWLLWTMAVA